MEWENRKTVMRTPLMDCAPGKNGDSVYWICQALGWFGYAAIGVAFGIQSLSGETSAGIALSGGVPALAVDWSLYPIYSIGLTHLLRRFIKSWMALPRWKIWVRVPVAVLAIGFVQISLICTVDYLMQGRQSIFFEPQALHWAAFGTTMATAQWTAIYFSVTAGRRRREQATQMRLAVREAELRALEAQINPHFLFNCLNSIRALVAENPARAQEMITRLANIFRYNLHRGASHTVPLASEVEAVGDYLALESVRFEERLRVQFAIAPGAEKAEVPSMLLQTLVENALKHGIAPLPDGGDLLIRAESDSAATKIVIENTGQLTSEKREATESNGLGLANTRERLRLLYGDRASLQLREAPAGRVVATVLIPA